MNAHRKINIRKDMKRRKTQAHQRIAAVAPAPALVIAVTAVTPVVAAAAAVAITYPILH